MQACVVQKEWATDPQHYKLPVGLRKQIFLEVMCNESVKFRQLWLYLCGWSSLFFPFLSRCETNHYSKFHLVWSMYDQQLGFSNKYVLPTGEILCKDLYLSVVIPFKNPSFHWDRVVFNLKNFTLWVKLHKIWPFIRRTVKVASAWMIKEKKSFTKC